MSETQTSSQAAGPQDEAEIAGLRAQLEETRDEAERNRLLMQQAHEELASLAEEHRRQQELLERHQAERTRAEALILALLERLEARA